MDQNNKNTEEKETTLTQNTIMPTMIDNEERTLLFNMEEKPKINTIYYYDDENEAEYVLWERS